MSRVADTTHEVTDRRHLPDASPQDAFEDVTHDDDDETARVAQCGDCNGAGCPDCVHGEIVVCDCALCLDREIRSGALR